MENITIPMEEYKELLQIKGRYEELKMQKIYMNFDKEPKKESKKTPSYPDTITLPYCPNYLNKTYAFYIDDLHKTRTFDIGL